jgi:antitoxin StbD
MKKNPLDKAAADSGSLDVALHCDEPADLVEECEAQTSSLDDLELVALCKSREGDPTMKVAIDDL